MGAAGLYMRSDDKRRTRDLAELPPGEAPAHLVVIDGTWDQAHRVYRDNAWIRALPHYRLHPDAPSNYRIRREPRFECLSTLEAVAIAIRITGHGPSPQPNAQIDRQSRIVIGKRLQRSHRCQEEGR